ncbi:M20/M25/M40 family metallo-hydrolase [Corynebacterium aquatimens]|uniref:Glutamate carboxypeptidase n=1 Tax=Corynebacterium aquatimens TaxID=1190508 RepID=A0A931GSG9_9CORY|nr:M20/M25/M40 family metallo-hydrolase [Corynebacterium aquatimens]MBG6122052.1 glutamate carboxypeptidase [Corynebacterium aquatimens]WJY65407.1 Carboxypeptidase G2 precursor [Corynebacterium aquatimens]
MSTELPVVSVPTVEKHLDAIIEDALSLVAIDSYTSDLPALQKCLDALLGLVEKRLGAPSSSVRHDGGDQGNIAVVTYEGTLPGTVVIVGHYDTVWPAGTVSAWAPPAHDDPRPRLSGPGLYDMKIGLTQGIWALKLIKDAGLPHPTVTYVFNGDEEIGSPSSQHIIQDTARDADAAFVLEASLDGKVKVARKGIGNVVVTANGIEAHAGLEPEKGANAIIALMEWCLKAVELQDIDAGTTINVGLVSGGSGANVVPGRAQATLDIRHWVPEETQRLDDGFDAITWSDQRVTVTADRNWNRPPMVYTDATKELFERLQRHAADLGHELEGVSVGGGSDANFISAIGTPVICGLGAGGGGAHARHEFIYPDTVPFFTALLASAITGTTPRHA